MEAARYEQLMEDLIEGPYWIIDILPEQVPANAPGQYFAVDEYFRKPERLAGLHRTFAELLLRVNCYHDMAVSFDDCETWEINPDPEDFVRNLIELSGFRYMRAVFEKEGAMAEIQPDDTYITLYDPDEKLLELVRELAGASGLFVWRP